ncbi:hypothetical protein ElyMa_002937200 [Elysia marginata]|uniref:Uncharacterized protein n=1 Tax=Elysia marginata TaxID=1093978 RepID=A0AAV4I777_9GAST|nr:hypothetical protein ElyMa_002937200 [Elysia marginata]
MSGQGHTVTEEAGGDNNCNTSSSTGNSLTPSAVTTASLSPRAITAVGSGWHGPIDCALSGDTRCDNRSLTMINDGRHFAMLKCERHPLTQYS